MHLSPSALAAAFWLLSAALAAPVPAELASSSSPDRRRDAEPAPAPLPLSDAKYSPEAIGLDSTNEPTRLALRAGTRTEDVFLASTSGGVYAVSDLHSKRPSRIEVDELRRIALPLDRVRLAEHYKPRPPSHLPPRWQDAPTDAEVQDQVRRGNVWAGGRRGPGGSSSNGGVSKGPRHVLRRVLKKSKWLIGRLIGWPAVSLMLGIGVCHAYIQVVKILAQKQHETDEIPLAREVEIGDAVMMEEKLVALVNR